MPSVEIMKICRKANYTPNWAPKALLKEMCFINWVLEFSFLLMMLLDEDCRGCGNVCAYETTLYDGNS